MAAGAAHNVEWPGTLRVGTLDKETAMADVKSKEQVKAEMDAAAEAALATLRHEVSEAVGDRAKGQLDVIEWFAANYMTAGHKRLGRGLVAISKGQ